MPNAKLIQPFSLHPMDQQWSPWWNNFLTFPPSYHNKVTPISALHADKVAEAVWIYLFKKSICGIPASFFRSIVVEVDCLQTCCSDLDTCKTFFPDNNHREQFELGSVAHSVEPPLLGRYSHSATRSAAGLASRQPSPMGEGGVHKIALKYSSRENI